MKHFINLTNGLQCCAPAEPHFLRIQSTWCEQKLFADVLLTVGADFLYHLATEDDLTIHDVSERGRVTRALWQGVPWIRYATQRIWGTGVDRPVGRNGQSLEHHFRQVFAALPERTVKQVRYFEKFCNGTAAEVSICEFGRTAVYRNAA